MCVCVRGGGGGGGGEGGSYFIGLRYFCHPIIHFSFSVEKFVGFPVFERMDYYCGFEL